MTTRRALGATAVLGAALVALALSARSCAVQAPEGSGVVSVPGRNVLVEVPPGPHSGRPVVPGRTTRRDEGARPPYIPPEATVRITPKIPGRTVDELVDIRFRSWGPCFRPGLDIGLAPLGLGVDAKLFYWNRLGLNAGVFAAMKPVQYISPSLGLSYRLDAYSLLKNTELAASWTPLGLIPISVAIRLNF